MTVSFRRYLALDILALMVMNSTFNASYAWWMWHPSDFVSLTGNDSIAFDLAATPIWIAVLTTLLGTPAVQNKLWEGRFREPTFAIPRLLGALPVKMAARAMTTGLIAAALLTLPLWLLLHQSALPTLLVEHVVITKVALTMLFTTCIVPLVVLAAIADMQGGRRTSLLRPGAAR